MVYFREKVRNKLFLAAMNFMLMNSVDYIDVENFFCGGEEVDSK